MNIKLNANTGGELSAPITQCPRFL